MEGWIYCTFWYFWSYKTLWNVKLMIDKLNAWEIVFSNIKLDINYINPHVRNNYYYFDDIKNLHDILAFAWFFAQSVSIYNDESIVLNEPKYPRYNRPKISVFFDEMWIFANAAEYRKFHKEVWQDLTQYLLQIRKLFVDLYLIIQKPNKLVKEIREYVQYWIQPEIRKKWILPLFFTVIDYSYVMLDDEWNQAFEQKLTFDNLWNMLNFKSPLKWDFFTIVNPSYYFPFYDDLYLNLQEEIVFKTNYLVDSKFFLNLANDKINNIYLYNNKNIYEKYINNYVENDIALQYVDLMNEKPRFLDNPHKYYLYLTWLWSEYGFLWFFKRIFSSSKNSVKK